MSDALYRRRLYLRTLLEGSLAVFVAAGIARSVSAIIAAIVGSDESFLFFFSISFLHALLIAHPVGLIFALNFSDSLASFDYWIHVFSEQVGFAWKQTFSLIIVTNFRHGLIEAFCVWMGICSAVICFIFLWSLFEAYYIRPNMFKRATAQSFTSDAFALGIAYGFTIIIASAFVVDASDSYLSSQDDDEALTDDKNKTPFNLFLVYVVAVTVLVFGLQHALDRCQASMMALSPNMDALTAGVEERRWSTLTLEKERSRSSVIALTTASILSTVPLAWKHTKRILSDLLTTTCGYAAACGWAVWSVLIFQQYFSDFAGGELVSLIVYALVISLVVLLCTAKFSSIDHSIIDNSKTCRMATKQRELVLSAGRLLVGWSWDEVIGALLALVLPGNGDDQRSLWLKAVVKTLMAAVIIVGGYWIDRGWRSFAGSAGAIGVTGGGDISTLAGVGAVTVAGDAAGEGGAVGVLSHQDGGHVESTVSAVSASPFHRSLRTSSSLELDLLPHRASLDTALL